MNHNHFITVVVRSFIVYASMVSMITHCGGDQPELDLKKALELQDKIASFRYEQTLAATERFKKAFNNNDQASIAQLKEEINNTATVWSFDGPYKLNNLCSEAYLEVLDGNDAQAKVLFQDADEQGSHWGAFGAGAFALRAGNVKKASDCFKRAYERDGHRIAKEELGAVCPDPIPAYRSIMTLLGFPSSGSIYDEERNLFTRIHQRIIDQSGKPRGYFYFPLSLVAAENNDKYAQEMCLNEAIKYENQYTPHALGMLARIQALRQQQAATSLPIEIAPLCDEGVSIGLAALGVYNDEEDNRLALEKELDAASQLSFKTTSGMLREAFLQQEYAKGNVEAAYELGRSYCAQGDDKKAWEPLRFAVQNNNVAAFPLFIERYLKSNDVQEKRAAAECFDRLLSDAALMEKAQLSTHQKGRLYAAAGVYASRRDKNKAIYLLQQASLMGNTDEAFLSGTLCFELGHENNNQYEQALNQFRLVQGEKKVCAAWYSQAIQMIKGNVVKLSDLLNALKESPEHEDVLKDIFSNTDVQTALRRQEESNPYAALLIAHCSHKGWGKTDKKPDDLLAYTYCINILKEPSLDNTLKKECVDCLQMLRDGGSQEAYLYLRRHYSTPEEQEVDAIYNGKLVPGLSEEVIAILIKDAKHDVYKSEANGLLGKYHGLRGRHYYELSIQTGITPTEKNQNEAMARQEYKKALEYYKEAKKNNNEEAKRQWPAIAYDLACITKDKDSQFDLIESAADDDEYPYAQACLSLYYYYKPSNRVVSLHYLDKARRLEEPEIVLFDIEDAYKSAKQDGSSLEPIRERVTALKNKLENGIKDDHIREVLDGLEKLEAKIDSENGTMLSIIDAILAKRDTYAYCRIEVRPSKDDPYLHCYLLARAYLECKRDSDHKKYATTLQFYEHLLRTIYEKKLVDEKVNTFHEFVFTELNEQHSKTFVTMEQGAAIKLRLLEIECWKAKIKNDNNEYEEKVTQLLLLATKVDNVAIVKKWYEIMPPEMLNKLTVQMVEAWLHVMNAYNKSPEEAHTAYVTKLEHIAEQNYVRAQKDLINLFVKDSHIAATDYIARADLKRAERWALRLLDNPEATDKDKLVAYRALACREKEKMLHEQNEENVRLAAYQKSKEYFDMLIEAEVYEGLLDYTQLFLNVGKLNGDEEQSSRLTAIGQRDFKAWLEKHWDNPGLWSQYLNVMTLGGNIVLGCPSMFKRWIQEKMHADVSAYKALGATSRFQCEMVIAIAQDRCDETANYALYGFNNITEQKEAKDKVDRISATIGKKSEKIFNNNKAAAVGTITSWNSKTGTLRLSMNHGKK